MPPTTTPGRSAEESDRSALGEPATPTCDRGGGSSRAARRRGCKAMQAASVCEVHLVIRHLEEQTSTLQANAVALQRDPARAHATPRSRRRLVPLSATARSVRAAIDPLSAASKCRPGRQTTVQTPRTAQSPRLSQQGVSWGGEVDAAFSQLVRRSLRLAASLTLPNGQYGFRRSAEIPWRK
jgi:hypothetical protein